MCARCVLVGGLQGVNLVFALCTGARLPQKVAWLGALPEGSAGVVGQMASHPQPSPLGWCGLFRSQEHWVAGFGSAGCPVGQRVGMVAGSFVCFGHTGGGLENCTSTV